MFIDEITIKSRAGKGGDGVVRWLHEKGREFAGPSGGDGGQGGDVYVWGVRDIGKLAEYRTKKEFYAEEGESGRNKSQKGRDGENLYISVPVGSVITNTATGDQFEVLKDEEKIMILRGGMGGYGNEHFKGSINRGPKEWTVGKPGEEAEFHIELRLIAEAGLIGLPNAGKSSLLNELTNASPKIGSYQFTTLEPNLGDFYGHILADIPGLIEGASDGKGLGHKFLRHIERTKLLLHCVSLENEDPIAVYNVVRKELEKYSPNLKDKEEIVLLTKADSVTEAEIKKAEKEFKKLKKETCVVSIIDDSLMIEFKKYLSDLLKKD